MTTVVLSIVGVVIVGFTFFFIRGMSRMERKE